MPAVPRYACDNPECPNEGVPEDGPAGAKVRPPYGWFKTRVEVYGSGPILTVVTCSAACIAPAFEKARRDEELELAKEPL